MVRASAFRNPALDFRVVPAPIPVSRSGVMFEAVASKAGVVNSKPPDNSFSAIGCPVAVFGVWQLSHANIELTRYWPRSVGVCAKAVVVVASKLAKHNILTRNICPPQVRQLAFPKLVGIRDVTKRLTSERRPAMP
jgi:hypothetical protein